MLCNAAQNVQLKNMYAHFKKTFEYPAAYYNFVLGEMAEWSNAAVLKTVNCNRFGGSNPSLSAQRDKHAKTAVCPFSFLPYSGDDPAPLLISSGS